MAEKEAEELLAGFINSSIEKNYEVVRKRANVISDEREEESGGAVKESPMQVSKNDDFCIQNEGLFIKNEEFCIQNDDF